MLLRLSFPLTLLYFNRSYLFSNRLQQLAGAREENEQLTSSLQSTTAQVGELTSQLERTADENTNLSQLLTTTQQELEATKQQLFTTQSTYSNYRENIITKVSQFPISPSPSLFNY